MKISSALFLSLIIFSLACTFALADFSSTNFQLENPVNIISGGDSSSTHFKYSSTTSQLTQGESTSSSFKENAGFMYFPTATSPVVTATPGNTQVTLFWTAATGILANISSYQVGVSTVSGGTFTYTSVGTSLNTIKTGLTNGTPYFFKVRSYAAGLLLSESAEVTATPTAAVPSGGGGGGVGGSITGVIFSGIAYPGSHVFVLKDGQMAGSTIAGGDAKFRLTLSDLSSGNFNFIIYGEDGMGRQSTLFPFTINVVSGVASDIGGIFLAPTIAVDKEEVKKGDNITILGQSVPEGNVSISVHSDPELFVNTVTDKYGSYVYNFDTSVLDMGDHVTKSKALKTGEISSFGRSISFKVGDQNILANALAAINQVPSCNTSVADLNSDCRVNLVDYSILAFWYKKDSPPTKYDLNKDGKINIIDFSIMAYYWTR